MIDKIRKGEKIIQKTQTKLNRKIMNFYQRQRKQKNKF